MRPRFGPSTRASGFLAAILAMVAALLACPAGTPHASAGPSGTRSAGEGTSWPYGQALPRFAETRHLDVVDVTDLADDEQLMFGTLQGIVNRDRPRIYLIDTESSAGEGSRTWLEDLNVPFTEHDSADALLSAYDDQVSGGVVYDPRVPDSINVATTLAGLRDGVVLSPELAEKFGQRFPVAEDLRGKFEDALDAYTWQYENLWPETTHRMLTALPPQREVDSEDGGDPEEPTMESFAFLRDYVVANQSMLFWLDPNVPGERALFEKILGEVEPGTPYLGWFSQDTDGEFEGTELVSSYGVYVLAADWFENLTVHSGSRAPVSDAPQEAPELPLENKIYVTMTMSEGDNLQYNQHRMRVLWDDPARGEVPITWSTTPILKDAAPTILNRFQTTATNNDLLIAGPSGAGYIYPNAWPDDSFDVFTRQTGKYLDSTGMDVVYALNRTDGEDVPLSPSKARAYAEDVAPAGMLLHWGESTELGWVGDDVPQSSVHGVGSLDEARTALTEAKKGWNGEHPAFVSLGILAWDLTPSDLKTLAAELDDDYAVVRGDQYLDLVGEALPN